MSAIPIPRICWPYVISAGVNDAIKFDARPAASTNTYTGTVAAGTYATPELLLAAFRTGMLASTRAGPVAFSADLSGGGAELTMSLSAAGVLSFSCGSLFDGSTLKMYWNTYSAAGIALADLLGMDSTADQTVVVALATGTITAAYQIRQLWTPDVPVRSDSGNRKTIHREEIRTAGGQSKVTDFWTLTDRELRFEFVAAAKALQASESGTTTNASLERLFVSTSGPGKFGYWPDRTVTGTYSTYFLRGDLLTSFADKIVTRMFPSLNVYSVNVSLGLWVTP